MLTIKFSSAFFLIFLAATAIQCSDPISVPPEIPVEILLSAPDTLNMEYQKIILSTSIWRDFQPISPPNGKPLTALIFLETTDSSVIGSLDADAIYVVHDNQVWRSYFSDEYRPPSELTPFRITKIARNGPKWGPGITVDVIVRIRSGDNYFLIRASGQEIFRSD